MKLRITSVLTLAINLLVCSLGLAAEARIVYLDAERFDLSTGTIAPVTQKVAGVRMYAVASVTFDLREQGAAQKGQIMLFNGGEKAIFIRKRLQVRDFYWKVPDKDRRVPKFVRTSFNTFPESFVLLRGGIPYSTGPNSITGEIEFGPETLGPVKMWSDETPRDLALGRDAILVVETEAFSMGDDEMTTLQFRLPLKAFVKE